MKLITKLALLFSLLLVFAACTDDVDGIPTDSKYEYYLGSLSITPASDYLIYGLDELRILSLNNSLIEYNEMNVIFNQLAVSGGKNAVWEKQTRLGQSLQYHFDEGDDMIGPGDPSAKYIVRSKEWTHIILQEQSSRPRTNFEGFRSSVKQWIEYIREYCPNPDAKILIMVNWPYDTSSNYDADMQEMFENTIKVARETGIGIIPAGNAYNIINTEEGSAMRNALYTDDRHPSVMASYLSACVFYNCLFNENPEGLEYYPSDITSSEAALMQKRAHEASKTYSSVSDYSGTVAYHYELLAPNGDILSAEDFPIIWSVDGGGTIDEDGVFYSDGTPGTYTVRAETTIENKEASASIRVINPDAVEQEYVSLQAGGSYTQDFNTIGTGAEAILPAGWRIEKMTGAAVQRTVGSFNNAGKTTELEGGENLASNATNGLYNFGASASFTDRAVGGITTGDTEKTQGINVYLHIKNNGSQTIPAMDLSFDIEKYRKGNNSAGFTAELYCSTDGLNWTSAGDNFKVSFDPDSETAGYDVVPGEIRSLSGILAESLSPGESLYFAWNFSVTSGTTSSGAQALALDNFSISARNSAPVDYIEVGDATYVQDFDVIGTSAEATLPQGWRIEKRLDFPRVVRFFSFAGYRTEQQGGINMSSSARNGLYNFGAGDAATATDRAIGGVSTGVDDGTRGVNIYSKYRNTGQAVSSVTVSYDVEKYRNGNNSNGFRIQMYYSKNGRDWTEAGGIFRTHFDADTDMNGLPEVPSETRTAAGTLSIPLERNEDLYLAWNYSVSSDSNCSGAMALGIDNVEVTFNR